MPRFVILEHDHPQLHWDFMLEAGSRLRTWRLPAPPRPGLRLPAEALPDHRSAYLDYEGPVSGGRGSVRRWDAGSFDWLETSGEVVGPNRLIVRLQGRLYSGTAELTCREGQTWEVVFGCEEDLELLVQEPE